MKVNKFFMLGLAGLAFAACSNEEEIGNQFPDGNGAVSVRILNPAVTRAVVAGTTESNGDNVQITGTLTVTLTYDTDKTQSISINASDITSSTVLKFWNITNPSKVEASVNGGQEDYSSVQINATSPAMQAMPNVIPAYGAAIGNDDIKLTNQSGTPDLNNQYDENNSSTSGKTETGAVEGDDKKTYQMYSAEIKMEIPVARLEVSGITHIEHPEGSSCKFKTLTIDGVYMDCLYETGSATSTTNYYWGTNASTGLPIGIGTKEAILKDEINLGVSFLKTAGAASAPMFPSEAGKVYAFNFYPGEQNPIFKIYFAQAEAADNASPILQPRYAMISKYKASADATEELKMEAGKIYRIKSAKLDDGNIIENEDGGDLVYGLTVTVEEATWEVVDIVAEWEN